MTPIRVVIVDDEKYCREGISALLKAHSDFELCGTYSNGRSAIEGILLSKPDVVFLDIQMPEVDGFDVLEAISVDGTPFIVFVTAYQQYAVKAFEAYALDYLIKPYAPRRFEQTLDRVRQRVHENHTKKLPGDIVAQIRSINSGLKIRVKADGNIHFIPSQELLAIESDGDYLRYHCASQILFARGSLKKHEGELHPLFFRVNKSVLINLSLLQKIDQTPETVVILPGQLQFKVSRRREKQLMEQVVGPK